jgi:aminopeptidase N
MKKISSVLLVSIVFISSCGSSKKAAKNDPAHAPVGQVSNGGDMTMDNTPVQKMAPDTVVKVAFQNYRASATIANQIRHTTIEASFDWNKCYMFGKATITAKPYFYPTDSLILDAKGMDIKEISLLKGKEKMPLKYSYDSLQLHIALDRTYTSRDSFMVFIDYVSMPNKLKDQQAGSMAITSHKGLFFINPDGKDLNKPRQIWTQGETEDNSCWFPTIDKPNQRMTEDIYITTEKENKTLSNGAMVSSKENSDGTHTDHWVMSPGIPPYLVMMAIGPFAIVKDTWRGKPVDFYVDPKYAPYAMDIFGKTPQMIELFSNLLHFPYVWNKYDQVIAHDYVSGAMENTTATLHGEFVQKTSQELVDDRLENEDIISHELFHHWFGDLVTCESWANISLNESFATYGEYLWREYKYGTDEADRLMQQNFTQYLGGGTGLPHDLVNFYYNDKEDMFDLTSYQKGGTILHMLRSVVGDSAFFNSLHLYLEEHKFSPVEVPMLRLAFEKVTGTDLNWFFNEWFYNKGQPNLSIKHSYDDKSHMVTLEVVQTQDLNETPVFKMPLWVNVYYNGKVDKHMVTISKSKDKFTFPASASPDWVDFDAEKVLLCVKNDEMTAAERTFQYEHGKTYIDRYEALNNLSQNMDNATTKTTLMKGLDDRYWYLRRFAMQKLSGDSTPAFKAKLQKLMVDSSSMVRAEAIAALSKVGNSSQMPMYEKATTDSSNSVIAEAINAIAKLDKDKGLKYAAKFEKTDDKNLLMGIGAIYSKYGSDANNDFFINAKDKVSGFEQIPYVALYGQFLQHCSDETVNKGLPVIASLAQKGDNNFVRYYAKNSLQQLQSMYQQRDSDLKGKISDAKAKNPNDPQIASLQAQLDSCIAMEKKVGDLIK